MADELNPPAEPVEPVTPDPAEPGEPAGDPVDAEPNAEAAELERLRAALAKANKDSERNRLRLKEIDDAKLSEIEKARRDADEAARELANLRSESLRQKVALEIGLPAKWVTRLHGDDEESLRADAAEILADLTKTRKPAPDPSQGPRSNALSEDDKLYESIFGSRKA